MSTSFRAELASSDSSRGSPKPNSSHGHSPRFRVRSAVVPHFMRSSPGGPEKAHSSSSSNSDGETTSQTSHNQVISHGEDITPPTSDDESTDCDEELAERVPVQLLLTGFPREWSSDDEWVMQLLSEFGALKFDVLLNRVGYPCRDTYLVTFRNKYCAIRAIKALHGSSCGDEYYERYHFYSVEELHVEGGYGDREVHRPDPTDDIKPKTVFDQWMSQLAPDVYRRRFYRQAERSTEMKLLHENPIYYVKPHSADDEERYIYRGHAPWGKGPRLDWEEEAILEKEDPVQMIDWDVSGSTGLVVNFGDREAADSRYPHISNMVSEWNSTSKPIHSLEFPKRLWSFNWWGLNTDRFDLAGYEKQYTMFRRENTPFADDFVHVEYLDLAISQDQRNRLSDEPLMFDTSVLPIPAVDSICTHDIDYEAERSEEEAEDTQVDREPEAGSGTWEYQRLVGMLKLSGNTTQNKNQTESENKHVGHSSSSFPDGAQGLSSDTVYTEFESFVGQDNVGYPAQGRPVHTYVSPSSDFIMGRIFGNRQETLVEDGFNTTAALPVRPQIPPPPGFGPVSNNQSTILMGFRVPSGLSASPPILPLPSIYPAQNKQIHSTPEYSEQDTAVEGDTDRMQLLRPKGIPLLEKMFRQDAEERASRDTGSYMQPPSTDISLLHTMFQRDAEERASRESASRETNHLQQSNPAGPSLLQTMFLRDAEERARGSKVNISQEQEPLSVDEVKHGMMSNDCYPINATVPFSTTPSQQNFDQVPLPQDGHDGQSPSCTAEGCSNVVQISDNVSKANREAFPPLSESSSNDERLEFLKLLLGISSSDESNDTPSTVSAATVADGAQSPVMDKALPAQTESVNSEEVQSSTQECRMPPLLVTIFEKKKKEAQPAEPPVSDELPASTPNCSMSPLLVTMFEKSLKEATAAESSTIQHPIVSDTSDVEASITQQKSEIQILVPAPKTPESGPTANIITPEGVSGAVETSLAVPIPHFDDGVGPQEEQVSSHENTCRALILHPALQTGPVQLEILWPASYTRRIFASMFMTEVLTGALGVYRYQQEQVTSIEMPSHLEGPYAITPENTCKALILHPGVQHEDAQSDSIPPDSDTTCIFVFMLTVGVFVTWMFPGLAGALMPLLFASLIFLLPDLFPGRVDRRFLTVLSDLREGIDASITDPGSHRIPGHLPQEQDEQEVDLSIGLG